ncbi:MAG: MFS transporter [bacterium]|nr:MFS transporter [bacterium]
MTILKNIFLLYKNAYSGLPKEAWMLSLVEFINRCGTMVLFFMTLYLTQTYGFTPVQAGQVISIFGFGALLGAYIGGRLADSIGAYAVQKFSLVSAGIAYILLGQVTTFWTISLMMFLAGVTAETLHPANATAISQVCSEEQRTRGFALNRLATNLGIAVGPALGGYLALIDYKLLFWVDGLTYLFAAAIFMLFFKTSRPTNITREKTAREVPPVWRDIYFLKILVFVFFIGIIFVQLFNTFPLYFRSVYGFRENSIGFLLVVNTAIIVLFEMLLLDALKKKSLRKTIAVGVLLLGLGFALMPLGRGFLFAAFTVVVWTFGEILSLPTITTMIANHSSDAVRGKYMGFFSFAFALSLIVGPALGAAVYDYFSPEVLWYSCGIMGILLYLGFYTLKPVNKQEPEKEDRDNKNKSA